MVLKGNSSEEREEYSERVGSGDGHFIKSQAGSLNCGCHKTLLRAEQPLERSVLLKVLPPFQLQTPLCTNRQKSAAEPQLRCTTPAGRTVAASPAPWTLMGP